MLCQILIVGDAPNRDAVVAIAVARTRVEIATAIEGQVVGAAARIRSTRPRDAVRAGVPQAISEDETGVWVVVG